MSTEIEHENYENLEAIKEFYDIGEILGSGTYGTVFKAIKIKTNTVQAFKIILKNPPNISDRGNQEIKILSKIKHPNIIILEKVLETPQKLILVFEYCPKELRKILDERKVLLEHEIQKIMKYLISAVYYLHLNAIVHRDLKVENILITDNPTDPDDEWFIKLIDYGLSSSKLAIIVKQTSQATVGPINMHAEFCGTPQYMAPELITKSYSRQCDIWSIGIIMYLLFKGSFPFRLTAVFQSSRDFRYAKDIITNTVVDYETIEGSNEAIELMKKCLTINPAMRITAGEMLHYDPWISGRNTNSERRNTNILLLMEEFNNNLKTKPFFASTTIANEGEFNVETNEILDEDDGLDSLHKNKVKKKKSKRKSTMFQISS